MIAGSLYFTFCASGQQVALANCPSLDEARLFVSQQQWTKAEQSLRHSIDHAPSCATTHYLLGYSFLKANEPDSSLKEYSIAAKLRSPNSDDLTAVASDYILLKAYSDAEHWLLQATQLNPVNSQAWYLLGRTQYNLDHNADAVDSFKHSLSIFPEDWRCEYNLGLAYERLQQPELARTAYLIAIEGVEKEGLRDAQPYLDLGILDRSQGHSQEALPLLTRAAEISSSNPLAFQELGRALSDSGRTADAIVAFKKAITLAPLAEAPHFFLGRLYRASGKLAEASEQFAIIQQQAKGQSNTITPNIDHPR